ncbi:hypothetical protein [Lacisediminihabitans sp. H27-G8]|uniref:hypothetical protein n=1 Tax=Lacisediminihabitans sp. H27-G8 TaxID=3111909 RepID=UPI0038FC28CE
MSTVRYANGSAARKEFSRFLKSAFVGQVVTVESAGHTLALIDAKVFRNHLERAAPARAKVSEAEGAIAIVIPGWPFAVETGSLDESLEEMIDVLREYASDWQARLHTTQNHSDNWALVQLVELSSDEELTAWLTGSS